MTAYLFSQHLLTAVTLTACWSAVLLVASAGASGAYLTVSEIFPMETRALAIAFFFAIGTGVGGITGPLLFASLVGTGKVPDTVIAFVDRRQPDDPGRARRRSSSESRPSGRAWRTSPGR